MHCHVVPFRSLTRRLLSAVAFLLLVLLFCTGCGGRQAEPAAAKPAAPVVSAAEPDTPLPELGDTELLAVIAQTDDFVKLVELQKSLKHAPAYTPAVAKAIKQRFDALSPSLVQAIRTSDDIFFLHDLKEQLAAAEIDAQLFAEVLGDRSEEILSELKPVEVSEALEISAFAFRSMGHRRYEISLLFHAKKALEEPRVQVIGHYDKKHAHYYPEHPERHYALWEMQSLPLSKNIWKAGQYVLLRRVVDAQPMPYRIQVNTLRHARPIILGWYGEP